MKLITNRNFAKAEATLRKYGLAGRADELALCIDSNDRSATRTVAEELRTLGQDLKLKDISKAAEQILQGLEDTL